jgi:hypothetical protein
MAADIDTRVKRTGGVIYVTMRLSDDHGVLEASTELRLNQVNKPGPRYDAVRSEPEKYARDECAAMLEVERAKREVRYGRMHKSSVRVAESNLNIATVKCGRTKEYDHGHVR